MRTTRAVAVVALGLLLAATGLWARGAEEDRPELPPAEQLLDRFAREEGGVEAAASKETLRGSGTMTMEGLGIGGEYTLYQARPDLNLTVVKLEELGTIPVFFGRQTDGRPEAGAFPDRGVRHEQRQ